MTKRLPNLILGLISLFAVRTATAQEYQTMPIASGLNADVIANGVGLANTSTTHTVDADDYVYMANNFQQTATSTLPPVGLPSNGIINSIVAATPGLSYQLGPLSGNNALRLDATTTVGTLTFATPTPVKTLYMLGATGNGPGTVTVLVNFSDGTSQSFTSVTVPDWFFVTTPPPAISGFGRLGRTSNTLDNQSGNPRLYQISIDIPAASQSKNITNVQITKTNTGGVVSIFAFSADVYTSCPAPTNLTYTSTTDGAVINWTAPASAPSSGYEYYTSASSTPPTASTTPTGTVAAGINTKTLTGYAIGSSYYFWIRSNCGATKGFWKQIVFTPGQIVLTYTTGDISSEYNTAPTITTVPACVANLSATVPPGFKIASVETRYNYTSQSSLFIEEQRSILACTTNNTTEAAIATAPGGSTGTYTYNRTGINIANNLEGNVAFQLRVWRVWGGSGCNVTYGKIDNNTWKVTLNLAYATCTTPATPSAANQNICPQATMGDLTVSGISGAVYKFYTTPTGGTAIAATAAVANGTYYVTQTIGTCESDRSAAFTVTLAPTAVPTAAAQTHCGGSTVANLTTTTGANIKWYAAETGGSSLVATTALATGNYYVSQTVGGCESARVAVAITVTTVAPPTVAAQTFCAGSGATVANLVATGEAGGTIKWYATETATTTLASTTVLGTGTYYVSQTVGICESVKVACQVTIASIVSPVIQAQQLCSGATVANLPVNPNISITYKWFATQTSTTPLTADTVLASGTYYVSQTIATCESAKASVVVTINTVTAPAVDDQEFCAGATVANLQATAATGATIKWYSSETSTTVLTATTALVSGTYYVSQSVNSCESGRDAVAVIVHEAVAAPVTTPQVACFGSTLADISVDAEEGATLNWYATATATTALASSTNVITGTTYYVSQTVGNCEGARASITVTLNSVPVPTEQVFTVCNSLTLADLPVEGIVGATFNWYATLTGTDQLADDTIVTAAVFYMSQTVDGCESGRTAIQVLLTNVASPNPAAQQAFCGESFVAALDSGGTSGYTVNWYDPSGDPVTPNATLVSGTYTVTQTNGDCESLPASVVVVVTAMPETPIGDDEQDYENGETVADLEVEFIAGATIQWYFFDEDVWIQIPETTPLIDGGVYGVVQIVGECESEILPITVNLILGTDDFGLANLSIYPNPSSDIMNIDARESITELSVYNLLGQKVLYQQVNNTSTQINISSLPSATYLLQVSGANGATATFKIVKQ